MVAARYIIRGLIDGSLSVLGVVLGAAISGNPLVVISAGIGGGVANGLSNILGALTAERAGTMVSLQQSEDHLVGSDIKLKDTKIYELEKKKIYRSGLYDGGSTIVGSLVPVFPFFFFDLGTAIMVSVMTTVVLLFLLGIYIGKLAKENVLFAGLKMAVFGLVTAVATYAITRAF